MRIEFESPTSVKLTSCNSRSEQIGEELKPAVDLRFCALLPNGVLGKIHPELCETLFKRSAQAGLPGVDEVSGATELRFPELKSPFTWEEEEGGYELVIDYGVDPEVTSVKLSDCKLHKVTFDTKQGGTCELKFTLSCAHGLTASAVGAIAMRVQHQMHIVLRHVEPVVA